MTANDYIDKFAEDAAEIYSKNTVTSYVSFIKKFIKWFTEHYGSDFNFSTISSKHIDKYTEEYLKDSSVRNIAHSFTALKAFFNWALQHGYINHNPAVQAQNIRRYKSTPQWLSKQDLIKINSFLSDSSAPLRARLMVSLALYAGLKTSEIAELKIENYDPDKSLLNITSGGKSRTVPLNAAVKRLLDLYLSKEKKKAKNSYLFCNRFGEMLTSRSIQRIIKKIGKEIGIEDLNLSVLRHTYARLLAESGADIAVIALLMDYKTEEGLPNIQSAIQYMPLTRNFEKEYKCEMKKAVEKLPEYYRKKIEGVDDAL